MVMKEGRIPLAKLVGDKKHEKCLGRISQELNEMLQSHDYPEDVQKIVTAHMREWVREWREKGVGKRNIPSRNSITVRLVALAAV